MPYADSACVQIALIVPLLVITLTSPLITPAILLLIAIAVVIELLCLPLRMALCFLLRQNANELCDEQDDIHKRYNEVPGGMHTHGAALYGQRKSVAGPPYRECMQPSTHSLQKKVVFRKVKQARLRIDFRIDFRMTPASRTSQKVVRGGCCRELVKFKSS